VKKLIAAAAAALMMSLSVTAFAVSDANQRIAERIKPHGSVCVEGQECEGVAIAGAAAPAGGGAKSGKEIFDTSCAACHTTGAAGAPVIGKVDQWADRIAQGLDTLHKHAIEGINAMPAKGTCMSCSDEDIIATVDYMVEQSQ
jgi:cytochrome c5